MVRKVRLELTRFSSADFKSAVSTIPPQAHKDDGAGFEPATLRFKA
jgi:hypothetical protein